MIYSPAVLKLWVVTHWWVVGVISVSRESHSKFKLLHALSKLIKKCINIFNRCWFSLHFFPSTSMYIQNYVGPENLCFKKWVVT